MRLKTTVLILTFICFIPFRVFTQPVEIQQQKKHHFFRKSLPDSNFVETYKKKLMVALIVTRKFQHINIASDNSGNKLIYKPNNPFGFGVGLSYHSISVDLTLKFPYLTKSYPKKGNSEIYRVRLGYNRPRLWFSTTAQSCRGFYLYNSERLDPEWFENNENFILRPDILNIAWYTSAYYSFNHDKITYHSSVGFDQRQKKSAGTFLLGGSVLLNYLSADSSMIPLAYSSDYSERMSMTDQLIVQYGLNFGYAHTILLSPQLYISLSIFPGIHYQTGNYTTLLNEKKKISGDFGSITEARVSIGYNTDKYYAGVTLNEIATLHFPRNSVLTNGYGYLKIFVGRRINLQNWKSKKKRK